MCGVGAYKCLAAWVSLAVGVVLSPICDALRMQMFIESRTIYQIRIRSPFGKGIVFASF